jgi:hypothetical protein
MYGILGYARVQDVCSSGVFERLVRAPTPLRGIATVVRVRALEGMGSQG